jgi:hypothetical protein
LESTDYLFVFYGVKKMKSRFNWSMSNLVALLRMNLFSLKDLWAWLNDRFPLPIDYTAQLPLFDAVT